MDIFTTDYLRHAEMAVVETLWQLHTLTVINSWWKCNYTASTPLKFHTLQILCTQLHQTLLPMWGSGACIFLATMIAITEICTCCK